MAPYQVMFPFFFSLFLLSFLFNFWFSPTRRRHWHRNTPLDVIGLEEGRGNCRHRRNTFPIGARKVYRDMKLRCIQIMAEGGSKMWADNQSVLPAAIRYIFQKNCGENPQLVPSNCRKNAWEWHWLSSTTCSSLQMAGYFFSPEFQVQTHLSKRPKPVFLRSVVVNVYHLPAIYNWSGVGVCLLWKRVKERIHFSFSFGYCSIFSCFPVVWIGEKKGISVNIHLLFVLVLLK